jgi:hypothetical protein
MNVPRRAGRSVRHHLHFLSRERWNDYFPGVRDIHAKALRRALRRASQASVKEELDILNAPPALFEVEEAYQEDDQRNYEAAKLPCGCHYFCEEDHYDPFEGDNLDFDDFPTDAEGYLIPNYDSKEVEKGEVLTEAMEELAPGYVWVEYDLSSKY